jgi:flagellar biosynthetic protein FlhB
MAEESFQEKSEQATPKRREDSRQKGQVARSAELSSVAILAAALLALWGLGGWMVSGMQGVMIEIFTEGYAINLDAMSAGAYMVSWGIDFAMVVAPFMGILFVVALLVNVAQVGIIFTGTPLMPKADRISPLSGLKRIFSKKGLVELAKGLFKVFVVGWVTYLTMKAEADGVLAYMHMEVGQIFALSADLILALIVRLVLLLLVMALLDYAFQRYDYEQNLRMTKQEVKEELKQQEGDPIVRSRIRSLQREMSQQRMMSDVGEADVVVTNPTHVAIALKYDTQNMHAPIVLAKGQRLIAQRIKELAREAGVPLVENKPLARALFKAVKIGEQIPEELFRATAEVLAFVFQLKRRQSTTSV